MAEWPFDQAPNVAAITSDRVLNGAAVCLVIHYSDDASWAFLDDRTFEVDRGKLIGMGEVLATDPSLADVADLPLGWTATRAHVGAPWRRAPDPDV